MSVLCYNLGLELYRNCSFCQCLSWLKESYEIGRQGHCIEPMKQGRTLRLIAIAYLESDAVRDWMKALNTAELSLTEHVHPSGLFLKLRVLLQGREVCYIFIYAISSVLNSEMVPVSMCTIYLGVWWTGSSD